VNEANCSVLEIQYGNARPNAKVVLEKRRQTKPDQQSWFFDESGVIRSKMNEYALESKPGSEYIYVVPYTGDIRQQWVLKDNRIINRSFASETLGLRKRLVLHDDADVLVGRYEGKPYQHWRVQYL